VEKREGGVVEGERRAAPMEKMRERMPRMSK